MKYKTVLFIANDIPAVNFGIRMAHTFETLGINQIILTLKPSLLLKLKLSKVEAYLLPSNKKEISIPNINILLKLSNYKLKENEIKKLYSSIFYFTNQIIKNKNIELLIETLKTLRDNYNIKVLLVNAGEGYLTEKYNELISKYDLTEQVIFVGMIPNEDIIRLMKSLDMFIQVSQKVIFDLVILEALACGLPVIASNDGGNKEIIKDGVNGFLVDPNNVEEIYLSVLQSRVLKSRNKIILDEKFSSENMVSEYQKLYG